MEFLISLFEALNLYSVQRGLGEHLRGLDVKCADYAGQSIYNIIFIYLFAINSAIILNYYYGLLNRRPFNRWWWWLVNVLVGASILFGISYMYTNNDYVSGNFCKQLQINGMDCVGFGLTAGIFSFAWCLLLSLIIKWKSTINRKIPF